MLRKVVVPFVAMAGWWLDGCASHGTLAPPVAARSPVADANAGPREAPLRPEMEALLQELDAFFAPTGNAGTAGSAPPPPHRRAPPRSGATATGRVARIDAMAFNGKSGKGPVCAPEDEPFAPSGRLCGDVRMPIATLTTEETVRVLRLLDEAEKAYGPGAARDGHYSSRAEVRCDFDPHHALVLYDDGGERLGTIAVCLTCHQWLVRPASPGTGSGRAVLLDDGERTTLASIFDAHRLGAWIFDDADPRGKEVFAYERELYGTEAEPTPRGLVRRRARLAVNASGVDQTKKLSALTRADRDALCTWTAETVRPNRRNGGSHGYECVDGAAWIASYGEKDCGSRPLDCAATVGELEACLRELREPEDLCSAPVAVCQTLMTCLPGLAKRPSR